MKKNILIAGAAALILSLGSAGFAQTFSSVFSSSGSDIAAPGAGIGGINNVHVIAGVDTDQDANEEVIYLRIEGDATSDTVSLRIFEADGTDNGFALKYSEDIIFTDNRIGNFNQYNDMIVADTDNADGPEIILYIGGPFGTGPITENLFVYASTADDDWSTSQTLLAGSDAIDDIMGIEVGDIDGDGTVEISLSDDGTDNFTVVSVASGTYALGTATLTTEVTQDGALQAGGSLYNHTIADLNGDGQPELIGTHFNNNGFSVIEGTAANTYALAFDDSPGAAANDGLFTPGNVENFDIDGDGANTVFGLSSDRGGIYALTGVTALSGDPLTSLTASVELTPGSLFGAVYQGTTTNGEQVPGQGLDITDVDGDGNEELMVAVNPDFGTAQDGEVVLLEYNGSGADNDISNYTLIDATTTGITTTGDGIYDVEGGSAAAILDMDGDGLAEVVIVGPAINEPGVQILELPMTLSVETWKQY